MTRITSDKLIVGPWVAKKTGAAFSPDLGEAIGLQRKGNIVAGVTYENYNRASIFCGIAVEGIMTPAYLYAIFHYPFVYCGVKKIIVSIAESNKKSIRLVEKMGFRKEAQILDASPDGSLLIYTMEKQHCRFIGDKYEQKLKSARRA